MAFDPITAALDLGGKVIDRVLPDKAANDAAKAQLLSTEFQAEAQQVLGQIEVDKVEAASNSRFVAGWRPWIGWVAGVAIGYGFVLQPFLASLIIICQAIAAHRPLTPEMLPKLDIADLMALVTTMLGMGALRSFDKQQGTGNGH